MNGMNSFAGTKAGVTGPGTRPARDGGDPVHDRVREAFIGCIERLEQLIGRENEALQSPTPIDFEDFNVRKTHALLEFSRASRAFAGPGSEAIESMLVNLRERLTENRSLLDRHLRAMREISSIMIKTIEAAESDGTYTNRLFAKK